MLMTHPCRFISCSKCAHSGVDVGSGEGCACVGASGRTGELSLPPAQFCCESKTALTKRNFFKKEIH